MKKQKHRRGKRLCSWELRLYVADTSPRSVLATGNLRSFCDRYLAGQYRLTVIDIVKHPALARENDILATPALVRVLPGPPKTLIGTLSNADQVFRALDLDKNPGELNDLLSRSAPPVASA